MSQYDAPGILRYEKIFGEDFVSPGGLETTRELAARLAPRPGARVLDVGSGLGGAAFWLARQYGAVVTGVDLAPEMVRSAALRARARGIDRVRFIEGDIRRVDFEAGAFDIVWSRDSLLHIPDKPELFSRLRRWLAADAGLLITDYARGVAEPSPGFRRYVDSSGYNLLDPESYAAVLREAGFTDVSAEDRTAEFEQILVSELETLEVADLDAVDRGYLAERWRMKLGFCRRGDLKWVILSGKPAENW